MSVDFLTSLKVYGVSIDTLSVVRSLNLSLGFFRTTVSKEDINLDKKVERDMIDRDMCGSFFAHLGNGFWIWLVCGPHPTLKSCSHHSVIHVDPSLEPLFVTRKHCWANVPGDHLPQGGYHVPGANKICVGDVARQQMWLMATGFVYW